MICPRCGTIDNDQAARCTRCGGSLARPPAGLAVDLAVDPAVVPAVERPTTDAPAAPAAVRAVEPGPVGPAFPDVGPGQPAPQPPQGPPSQRPPGAGSDRPTGQWSPAQGAPLYPRPEGLPGPERPGRRPPGRHRQETRARNDGSGLSVPNYLIWSILCLLLWTIGGGVAIFYSVKANRLLAAGDRDGAIRASHVARTWCWVSVAVGALLLILFASGAIALPSYSR